MPMKTDREIVLRAAELVTDGWCRNDYARDEDGDPADATNSVAVCFCAEGALQRALHEDGRENSWDDMILLSHAIAKEMLACGTLVDFNDHDAGAAFEVANLLRDYAEKLP